MNTDTLTDIQKKWQSMGRPSGGTEQTRRLVSRLHNRSVGPLTRRLRRRFCLLMLCSWLVIVQGVGMHHQFDVDNTLLQVVFSLFGLICLLANFVMWYRFSENRFIGLPCIQAAAHVRRMRAMLKYMRIVGISLAVPVVIFFLYVVGGDDLYMWLAGSVGGIVGAALGIRIELNISRDINRLLSSFDDTAADNGAEA